MGQKAVPLEFWIGVWPTTRETTAVWRKERHSARQASWQGVADYPGTNQMQWKIWRVSSEFQLLEGQNLVTWYGWILVVIFVVSVMRVVVLEVILKEKIDCFTETANKRHNIFQVVHIQD
jgi:hypothetical protein